MISYESAQNIDAKALEKYIENELKLNKSIIKKTPADVIKYVYDPEKYHVLTDGIINFKIDTLFYTDSSDNGMSYVVIFRSVPYSPGVLTDIYINRYIDINKLIECLKNYYKEERWKIFL